MKINYKNKDLKIINWNREYSCGPCAFNSHYNLYYCNLFCRHGKIWTKNIVNSGIFRV